MDLISNLMKKYGYINDYQYEWYSSSFLQELYNSPVEDEADKIRSSSIYEEEESVKSEKKKIRTKLKKDNSKAKNDCNNIRMFSDMMNNMNEFDLIYNKNMISSKNIKQKMFLDKFKKPNCKNIITTSIDNYVNDELYKRKRMSSY